MMTRHSEIRGFGADDDHLEDGMAIAREDSFWRWLLRVEVFLAMMAMVLMFKWWYVLPWAALTAIFLGPLMKR
jgi:hypothetical protein